MSVLDKSFLKNILNPVKEIDTYDEYENYLNTEITQILNAKLLYHSVGPDNDCDRECFLVYKYEDKYIVINIFMGTCSACNSQMSYRDTILDAVERCYVSTNFGDVKRYYMDILGNDDSPLKVLGIIGLYGIPHNTI